ncbi:uncharacterized protein TM35_000261720 [Trypanosoma theileri]|uniref:Uncharacterized protein n=1 Tax=Trypanosoma theileri TaxID=67003 RepID=A0A1X0NRI5_9TRYP|nr:uncharacterized protein TM35_000261720 [Trypanosoma theileri]ORC86720.1 hypothetical protein TM35_000261720 [Trypanosoma theileri]
MCGCRNARGNFAKATTKRGAQKTFEGLLPVVSECGEGQSRLTGSPPVRFERPQGPVCTLLCVWHRLIEGPGVPHCPTAPSALVRRTSGISRWGKIYSDSKRKCEQDAGHHRHGNGETIVGRTV